MRLAIPVVPSRRAAWLFLLVSGLFFVTTAGALLADLVLLALVLWDAHRRPVPKVARRLPDIGALNTVSEVSLQVTSQDTRAARLRLTDDLDPALARTATRVGQNWTDGVVLDLPAGATVGLCYDIRPRMRGFLRLGDLHLRVLGPLGLAWRRFTVPADDILRVQPGVRDLLRRKTHGIRWHLPEIGPRRTRSKGEGREFESLREYVQGDDPRLIDWKASARHGRHVVRNYEAERNQHVVLAIDAGRHMRERIGDRERADFALSASMLLASRARLYGDRLGVMVFNDQIRHLSPARPVNLARLAELLTGVETRLTEPNYPLALATLARTFRRRSLVVLFCDIIDKTVSRALVQSLTRIAGSHLPLAVAIQNPDLEKAATTRVHNADYGFFRAASEELVQSRATALQAMRRSGILVVDTAPGDTLARTLDKYTEIKERGLL